MIKRKNAKAKGFDTQDDDDFDKDDGYEKDEVLLPEAIDESFMKALVPKAIEVAKKAHEGQVGDDGSLYYSHVENVAKMVLRQSDTHAYITALLHDVIESGRVTFEDLEKAFTTDIAKDVQLLSRRPQVDFDTYMKAIILKYVPFYIKLVDRLDNLKSLHHSPASGLEDYQQQTRAEFLPIAKTSRYAKLSEFAALLGEIEKLV